MDWMLLSGGIIALAVAVILTPVVIRIAYRMDWLAYPSENRWHSRPTPMMGGIAIFLAAAAGVVALSTSVLPWSILLGASLMFVTGLVDDRRGLTPAIKLIAQVIAAGCLLYAGYRFAPGWPIWISVPLTFFWLVGITNALNLLDNMDGLAAGIAATAAVSLALFSAWAGDVGSTQLAATVAGAAIGFLFYNFKPARIFMGDSGSLFLGYSVAALALVCQGNTFDPDGFSAYLLSMAVLIVPIFDTTLVTVMRKMTGRPVSRGGRDHVSHRLVFAGLSERQAVLTLYAVSAISGLLAILFLTADAQLFYAIAIYVTLAMLVFGVYLARANVYTETSEWAAPDNKLFALIHAFFGRHWKEIFGVGADLLLIIASFIMAYHLRFEDGLTPEREAFLLNVLPLVVAVKLVIFVTGGLYNAIWRHAGTPEIVRIVRTTALASAATFVAVGLSSGLSALSKGVFLIDWMIVTISVTGLRFGFRALRQYISSKRDSGRRVLLYGAGEGGLIAIRELRNNGRHGRAPIGFLDDDPTKQGMAVQGVPVVGCFADLAHACRQHKIAEVVVTTARIPDSKRIQIAERCAEIEIACSVFQLQFSSITENMPVLDSGGDGAVRSIPSPSVPTR